MKKAMEAALELAEKESTAKFDLHASNRRLKQFISTRSAEAGKEAEAAHVLPPPLPPPPRCSSYPPAPPAITPFILCVLTERHAAGFGGAARAA